MKRGDKTQVWAIPVNGGEATQITNADESVLAFKWHPDGTHVGYVATQPKNKQEKALEKKGYFFVFYEEALAQRNLFLVSISPDSFPAPRQMTKGISIWSFEFSPDGRSAAVAASDQPLIDQNYMDQQISLVDVQSGGIHPLATPPGKLGNFVFAPNGSTLAFTGARDRHDNAVSQVFTVPVTGGPLSNATPENFAGHVTWVAWKDSETLLYRAEEGVQMTLRTGRPGSRESKVLLNSTDAGFVFEGVSLSRSGDRAAMIGQSPVVPGDLCLWNGDRSLKRATTLNPWLAQRLLGQQTLARYKARDGRDIEGFVLHPVNEEPAKHYPMVVVVHGGPESHYSNGWLSTYSDPGQVLAGKGYLVFYPNYRSSTGYGTAFAAEGFGDPAGKEFDDIADGIDYLTEKGNADRERVGLGGGSYGGFASAWFATYYTKYVRAVVMFVGISDLISKQSTTDIPGEELAVHAGKPIEQTWDFSLKRSPVYWAHQSTTATLICGGADDTRVHPSQGIELFRRMKINHHPAVRLVQYPGEQHGNARQPARIDILFRTLEWYDWYVKDAKPLNGPMPRLDISDRYGLDLPQ
jgi:dipeptidyl aminopeptidase/acylaminoacyl peptidase